MKNIALLVAVATVSFSLLSSCNKEDMGDMPMDKKIDYPAAYVVNGESATVSVIKLSDNTISETFDIMNPGGNMVMWPHHIYGYKNNLAIGVPGMDLSAGHSGGMAGMKGRILIMDAVKGTIVKDIETPAMNHNAVYSPDGTEIWTTQMAADGKVLVYDANTYAIKNTIIVGKDPAEVTFSTDGTKAYVCNGGSGTVSVINPSSKTVATTLTVGEDPVGAWPARDGKMYVDNEASETISVIDVDSNTVDETIDLGFMPGYAAYNALKNELWVTDPKNGKVHYWKWDNGMNMWMHSGAFVAGSGAHAIVFTQDGNTAYVTNQESNTVSIINVSSHVVTKTLNVGKKPNGILIKM